jgi:6-phosphogluconolactonase
MKNILLLVAICLSAPVFSQSETLVIGTYTNSGSHGIYAANFDTLTGKITLLDSVSASNPSYLCLAPNGRNLYAVSETAANKPGSVLSFDFNAETGRMKLLNAQSSGGDHPCYIGINEFGNYVVVANYSGGSLSILPVDKMGTLKPAAQVIQRYGSGPNKQRQEKSHVHQALFSPGQKFVVINDLGTDEVVAYPMNTKKKKRLLLDTAKVKKIKLSPGTGPRHLAFHPTKPIFYVMGEMTGRVSVHTFGKKRIAWLQTIESDTISNNPGSADIHVSPDGKYLYATNRADANNISIFSINESDGKLKLIGLEPTKGKVPRNFVIHPSGNWLLVANQASNNIVVFKRDQQTGLLTDTNTQLRLPSPVCLVFGK